MSLPQLEQDLLASIPTWEREAGRPFLVHGESIMQLLMETVSAADQENRRKPPRAGSVPPRATTPVNPSNSYVPGVKTGAVTPAVRPALHSSSSVPNKRQRLGENLLSGHTPIHADGVRAPLCASRSNNGGGSGMYRAVSPTKIPSKKPNFSGDSSSRPPAISMIMPKPGTQHHALGHGRVPSSVVYGGAVGSGSYPAGVRSSTASSQGYGRFPSSDYAKKVDESGMMKKATRASRESFKPRPSMDALDMGMSVGVSGTRWGGGFTLKEEDEGY